MISYMISYFKKDHLAYNIKANDYEKKPLFISSKENQALPVAWRAALGLRRQSVLQLP